MFPGDAVYVYGNFGVNAGSSVDVNVIGSDSVALDYSGKNGAMYEVVLVNAKGMTMKNVPILAASGTTYPTK